MTLNEWAARKRLALYEELRAGLLPSEGAYDMDALAQARAKGQPQMGTTRYEPEAAIFEFIYPDPLGTPAILSVRFTPPERIVFLPVPSWVVENIWQGDISGTHHFEGEAMRPVEELRTQLSQEGNLRWFDKQDAKRRE